MKRAFSIVAGLLLTLPVSLAWGQSSSYDPAARRPSKPSTGIVDFALGQINPKNTDYGCQMDQARKLLVEETVRNIDSWAVLGSLALLVASLLLLLHQGRERSRREVIAAVFLAQYHNAWVDARVQAVEAIRRYNDLVHATSGNGATVPRSPSTDIQAIPTREINPDPGRQEKTPLRPGSVTRGSIRAGEYGADRGGETRGPQVDLIAQISTLQQQLNASHEREKNLQKELSKAQRRAPAVQPSGENLPG